MSDQLNQDVCDWTKRAAIEEIENLKSIRSTAWDEHTHSFRWLMASLLGVNGAACVSILGQDKIEVIYRLWACGCFSVGISSALLVAVFGQYSVQKSLAPLQKFIGYWMTVAEDGQRDSGIEDAIVQEMKLSAKIGLGSRISGWVSAITFLAGMAVSGMGMLQPVNSSEHDAKVAKEQIVNGRSLRPHVIPHQ